MTFQTVIMVDWSGGNDRGATPKKDAIWACIASNGNPETPVYLRNRQVADAWITKVLTAELAAGRRTLVAFDLCFAYPIGFAEKLTGSADPLALWDWFAARVVDAPTKNNRFALAGQINAFFPGTGPFWFNATKTDIANLPRKGTDRENHGLPEKRKTDIAAKGAFSPWQLAGAGAVGGQVFMGMPTLARLRHHFGANLSVWPFQQPDTQIVMAETYFSLLPDPLNAHPIKDAAQVCLYASRFSALSPHQWTQILNHSADPEGWVLGLGHKDLLKARMTLKPPPLRNDCFAMPQGAHWTPVKTALAHLKNHLHPVTGTEEIALTDAANRILASDITAARAHPPHANAAVDGYGFAGGRAAGAHTIPLLNGRAAAGQPFADQVAKDHAIRILTGANIPKGVDTVILQEDVTTDGKNIAFHGPLKQGANTRKAGEDIKAGATILHAGHKITPADLGTMAAVGVGKVTVHTRLRVGILSTGDELVAPGQIANDGEIYDANRPMLCATVARWGYDAIDLGCAPDDRTQLRAILSDAATCCDVILTSGGASAGEEDHISALLQNTGSLALWRVAMKPGRPLALGLWDETPVFGLPGNPVAAQICALIFARPALSKLAGGYWLEPTGFLLPAAFAKSKKAGRREYLRARIENGKAVPFPSEGSGRISGLSWATGLIALPDDACEITHDDPVQFIPFGSFDL